MSQNALFLISISINFFVSILISKIILQIGAKFTNAGIAPDEFAQPNLTLSYDGKRDRWNGYDPSQHKAIIEEYQKVEDAKRELRAKKLEEGRFRHLKNETDRLVFFTE